MEQNRFKRLWQHLLHPQARVARYFPQERLEHIARETARSEQAHDGQIRFVIESSMPVAAVLNHTAPRQRAWQWFAELGVWDTETNCGVLVYISFADHAVEVAADRGIAAKVPQGEWQHVCGIIEEAFGRAAYSEGLESGLKEVGRILSEYAPQRGADEHNELPDDVVLR